MTLAVSIDWASLLQAAYVSAVFGIGIMPRLLFSEYVPIACADEVIA